MRLEHVDADVIQACTNSAVQELWLPLVFVNLYDKLLLIPDFYLVSVFFVSTIPAWSIGVIVV